MTDEPIETPPADPPAEAPKRETVALPAPLYDFTILVADVATDAIPIMGPMGYHDLIKPTQKLLRDAIQRKDVRQLMNGALTLGGIALALYMVANPGYTRGLRAAKNGKEAGDAPGGKEAEAETET